MSFHSDQVFPLCLQHLRHPTKVCAILSWNLDKTYPPTVLTNFFYWVHRLFQNQNKQSNKQKNEVFSGPTLLVASLLFTNKILLSPGSLSRRSKSNVFTLNFPKSRPLSNLSALSHTYLFGK